MRMRGIVVVIVRMVAVMVVIMRSGAVAPAMIVLMVIVRGRRGIGRSVMMGRLGFRINRHRHGGNAVPYDALGPDRKRLKSKQFERRAHAAHVGTKIGKHPQQHVAGSPAKRVDMECFLPHGAS